MLENLTGRITRLTRFFFFTLAVIVLGWGFGGAPPFLAGMALGLGIGYIGVVHLAKRVHRFGQAVAQGDRLPSLGTFTRLALVALATVTVMTYPQHFEYTGLVLGLVLPTVFAIGDAIYTQLKQGK
ncbi:hypothetical protein GCM10010965_18190 [Caldalkalibacillus thermarum]|uniref:ATP synthase subunit I n=1 Tax=Caldalkalibacillus thermarum TaxID=296745 RepID=UPI001663B910|nr:ATP synthase subunit I [Caldalkalibacillus thermarum]GGK25800.1 hypothetical protein GCM10010965_18190 [Caldalkalibacillus thermarum]